MRASGKKKNPGVDRTGGFSIPRFVLPGLYCVTRACRKKEKTPAPIKIGAKNVMSGALGGCRWHAVFNCNIPAD
jgi:hypothetical protein